MYFRWYEMNDYGHTPQHQNCSKSSASYPGQTSHLVMSDYPKIRVCIVKLYQENIPNYSCIDLFGYISFNKSACKNVP